MNQSAYISIFCTLYYFFYSSWASFSLAFVWFPSPLSSTKPVVFSSCSRSAAWVKLIWVADSCPAAACVTPLKAAKCLLTSHTPPPSGCQRGSCWKPLGPQSSLSFQTECLLQLSVTFTGLACQAPLHIHPPPTPPPLLKRLETSWINCNRNTSCEVRKLLFLTEHSGTMTCLNATFLFFFNDSYVQNTLRKRFLVLKIASDEEFQLFCPATLLETCCCHTFSLCQQLLATVLE